MQITMQRTRPVWPAKTKKNDSRLLKNSEANGHDEWNFCREQEAVDADIALFLQETRIRKIIKSFEENYSRSLPETIGNRAITSGEPWNAETNNEMHQSQVNMCFLRGPLRRLAAQKNPKFLRSLQNGQRDTTNLAITPINAKFAKTIDCLIDWSLIIDHCIVNQHDPLAT